LQITYFLGHGIPFSIDCTTTFKPSRLISVRDNGQIHRDSTRDSEQDLQTCSYQEQVNHHYIPAKEVSTEAKVPEFCKLAHGQQTNLRRSKVPLLLAQRVRHRK
jgi:hypothetical protein